MLSRSLAGVATDRRRRTRRRRPAVALALVAAAPAYAATGKIDQVTPNGGGRVTVLFGAVGLAAGAEHRPEVGDRPHRRQEVPATAVPVRRQRRQGAPRRDARDRHQREHAHGRRARRAPSRQPPRTSSRYRRTSRSGSSRSPTSRAWSARRPPTGQRSLAAVDKLVAVGRTALYDGVVLATSALGTTGSRSIVLLSDGKDTDSTATLASAAAGLEVRPRPVERRLAGQRRGAADPVRRVGDARRPPAAARWSPSRTRPS